MQIKAKVIACFGNQAQIYSEDFSDLPICQLKKNLSLVAGDEILCELKNQEAVFIKKLTNNTSKYFYRYTKDKPKPLAANVDNLIIVCATMPTPIAILIDSFLILAESQNINACLVFNKIDLTANSQVAEFKQTYANLKYPYFEVSSQTQTGINELKNFLLGKTSAFCGASGVGKSSLLNCLMPKANAQVGDIGKSRGKHTTSVARLYSNADYDLIDLPGANNILPEALPSQMVLSAYTEIGDFLHTCKFRDCNHKDANTCGLHKAYAQGVIKNLRWQNLQKLLDKA